ncbi:MAG TPA: hypothetical protein PLX33_08285, partial [Alphaproteobacteria bacterium]|nr:hypothetical protein [Alphaproteobacteria bacterium]
MRYAPFSSSIITKRKKAGTGFLPDTSLEVGLVQVKSRVVKGVSGWRKCRGEGSFQKALERKDGIDELLSVARLLD